MAPLVEHSLDDIVDLLIGEQTSADIANGGIRVPANPSPRPAAEWLRPLRRGKQDWPTKWPRRLVPFSP